ncbi:dihydroneopterin aldolase [Paraburkholderia phymatum]|uniref:dihydroneopterin aldolase n=1 Tax=Paraburkholderia phymatum TaxID=148447 RepID=UPI0031802614
MSGIVHSEGHVADLAQHRRLFLRNRRVNLTDPEHDDQEAAFFISVDLYVPYGACTPASDSLDEVVDYEVMWHAIEDCRRAHIGGVADFCGAVAQRLISNAAIRAVRVRACRRGEDAAGTQSSYETVYAIRH